MATAPRRRAIVTGAAGFIGSHLAEALLADGHEVVGVDVFSPYYAPSAKRENILRAAASPRFRLLPGDLNDLDLREIVRAGDVVFHLAAQAGVRASWGSSFAGYAQANIEATQRLLEASVAVPDVRIVFASSSSVYGDAPMPMDEDGPTRPISPYGITKLTAEQLCLAYGRAFGLEVVPLRFFSVYGPRQRPDMAFRRFIDAVIDETPVAVYGDGSQRRDFTYVADVVRVLRVAADRGQPGLPVNVGGGSTVSVMEALSILEKLIGRQAIVEHHEAPPGDARDTQASTDRLKRLDASTMTGIDEGLARQVEWQLSKRGTASDAIARRRSIGSRQGSKGSARPIVLYSHDTFGLGHVRRNLAIAHTILDKAPETRVVLITGLGVPLEWLRQGKIEVARMPTAVKVGAEEYRPAEDRSMSGLLAERAGLIATTLVRLQPRALLVDHAPIGMKGELRLALQLLREQMPETRVILGLRDIVDDPSVVVAAWRDQGAYEVLESSYDEVLVYGSPLAFDVRDLYEMPPGVRARTSFTGYVGRASGMEPAPREEVWPTNGTSPHYLVTGGGGGDALDLFRTFVAAWPDIEARTGGSALFVAGPRMSAEDREEASIAARALPNVRLVSSSLEMLGLTSRADCIVAMAGYNTVVEALSARRPLVVMPRTAPRTEQLIRARLLGDLGLAKVVLPGPNAASELASASVAAITAEPLPPDRWEQLDLDGRERVAVALLRVDASVRA